MRLHHLCWGRGYCQHSNFPLATMEMLASLKFHGSSPFVPIVLEAWELFWHMQTQWLWEVKHTGIQTVPQCRFFVWCYWAILRRSCYRLPSKLTRMAAQAITTPPRLPQWWNQFVELWDELLSVGLLRDTLDGKWKYYWEFTHFPSWFWTKNSKGI